MWEVCRLMFRHRSLQVPRCQEARVSGYLQTRGLGRW